jgi:hypothetical protein
MNAIRTMQMRLPGMVVKNPGPLVGMPFKMKREMAGHLPMAEVPASGLQGGNPIREGMYTLKARIYMKKKNDLCTAICCANIELLGSTGVRYQQGACKGKRRYQVVQYFSTAIVRTTIAKDQFKQDPPLAFKGGNQQGKSR